MKVYKVCLTHSVRASEQTYHIIAANPARAIARAWVLWRKDRYYDADTSTALALGDAINAGPVRV